MGERQGSTLNAADLPNPVNGATEKDVSADPHLEALRVQRHVAHPRAGGFMCNNQPSLLLLPTGEVMLNLNFVNQISGTQFNGLSQANAFNDEFQVATNFPLVRITNDATGDVSYAKIQHDGRVDRLQDRFNLV
jgi:hypothetical protein